MSMGYSGSAAVKNLPDYSGDACFIPGSGRFAGEGSDTAFQYSCLENLMDQRVWQATAHGITKSLMT